MLNFKSRSFYFDQTRENVTPELSPAVQNNMYPKEYKEHFQNKEASYINMVGCI